MKITPFVLLLSATLHAQIPDAPQLHHIDRVEWTLLATDAATRSLDVYSTHKMLANEGREILLPGFVANHPAVMGAVEAGYVMGHAWMAKKLSARHRKLAHVLTAVDIGIDAPWAIHNLFLTKPVPVVRGRVFHN